MRTLLLSAPEDHETGVVLFGEELERGGVLEGVDGILLGEFLGEGLAHVVEVVEGILDELGAGCATEEETGFGVLDGFRLSLLESTL